MKKLMNLVVGFAKQRPSLFIVSVIALVCIMMFATYEVLHLTSTPQFCGWCHKDKPSGPGGENYSWEANIHSFVNVGCIDCHGKPGIIGYGRAKVGGLYDLGAEFILSEQEKLAILTKGATDEKHAAKLVPNEWCLFCHSDESNKVTRETTFMTFLGLPMRNLDKVVNPQFREQYGLQDLFTGEPPVGVNPNHSMHVKELKLSCANCHMGVAHGGELFNKTKMQGCFTCHEDERAKGQKKLMPATDDCVKCHQLPLQEQEGTFLKSKGIEDTPWIMPSIIGECSSCHVDAFTPPTAQQCIDCHDESYAEIFDMYKTDFTEQKNELTPIYMGLLKSIEKMNAEQRAKFNELNYFYILIDRDGSSGVHNPDLMNEIFTKANEIAEPLAKTLVGK